MLFALALSIPHQDTVSNVEMVTASTLLHALQGMGGMAVLSAFQGRSPSAEEWFGAMLLGIGAGFFESLALPVIVHGERLARQKIKDVTQ